MSNWDEEVRVYFAPPKNQKELLDLFQFFIDTMKDVENDLDEMENMLRAVPRHAA